VLFRRAKSPAPDRLSVAKAVGDHLARADSGRALAAIEDFARQPAPGPSARDLTRLLRGAASRARKASETDEARRKAGDALARVLEALLFSPHGASVAEFAGDEPEAAKGLTASTGLAAILRLLSAIRALRRGDGAAARSAADAPGLPPSLAFVPALLLLLANAGSDGPQSSAAHEPEAIAAVDRVRPPGATVPRPLLPETIRLAVATNSPTVRNWVAAELSTTAGAAYATFFTALSADDGRSALSALAVVEDQACPLPQPHLGHLLHRLLAAEVPAVAVADYFEGNAEEHSQALVTVGAVALAQAGRHDAARALADAALRSELDRWDGSADAFGRLDYLVTLYGHVVLSARRRALKRHSADAVLADWQDALKTALTSGSLSASDRIRAFDGILSLEDLRGADAGPTVLRDAVALVLADPELRREPRVLARIARSAGKARFVAAGLPPDFDTAVAETIERNPPGTTETITSGNLAALIRLLEHAGRGSELASLTARLGDADLSRADRIKLASALMRTSGRAVSLAAAQVLLQEAANGAPEMAIEAGIRLADLAPIEQAVATADDVAKAASGSATGLVARHRFGAAAAAALMRRLGQQSAVAALSDGSASALSALFDSVDEAEESEFLAECDRVLARHPQPAQPRAVIAIMAETAAEVSMLPLLAFSELKRRGSAVVPLFPGLLAAHRTGIAAIDDLDASISPRRTATRWHRQPVSLIHDWTIDLPNRIARCEGVDLFPGINEALCLAYRRYTIDYASPAMLAEAMRQVADMDLMIAATARLKAVAVGTGIPVKVFLPLHHFGWRFAVRAYANAVSRDGDLSVFQSANGYENYVRNFSAAFASTLAVRDMTRHAKLSKSYMPPADEFHRWFDTEWSPLRDHPANGDRGVRINRVVRTEDASAGAIAALKAERAAGRRVVCLFGKVLFDQAVPEVGGPAHRDMRDWFDHTMAIAAADPRMLLLIKPHPHEVREEIALYPTELLSDWLPRPCPANIRFLPHNLLNLYEMEGVLDLALIWNGSAAVELGILGVPTIVSGGYGGIDYPVGHRMPRDRADYEGLLANPGEVPADAAIGDRCRAYLAYTQGPLVSTPYRYTRRSLTNQKVRQGWFAEDLAAFARDGDPYVDFIADRIDGADAAPPPARRPIEPA